MNDIKKTNLLLVMSQIGYHWTYVNKIKDYINKECKNIKMIIPLSRIDIDFHTEKREGQKDECM